MKRSTIAEVATATFLTAEIIAGAGLLAGCSGDETAPSSTSETSHATSNTGPQPTTCTARIGSVALVNKEAREFKLTGIDYPAACGMAPTEVPIYQYDTETTLSDRKSVGSMKKGAVFRIGCISVNFFGIKSGDAQGIVDPALAASSILQTSGISYERCVPPMSAR